MTARNAYTSLYTSLMDREKETQSNCKSDSCIWNVSQL